MFTNNKINTAIILAGGQNPHLIPLTRYKTIPILPILNKPMIDHTICFLKKHNVNNILIAGSRDSNVEGHIKYLKQNNGANIDIQYIEEDKPRGTAGVLRDLQDFIKDKNFLVINCNTFIDDIDIDDVLAFHNEKDSMVTIGVKKTLEYHMEGINITQEGVVNGFHIIHPSREKRSSLKPTGIYIFKSDVLKFIDTNGYFDIKEQLIPILRKASLPVHIHELNGYCKPINTIDDYYNVHKECLLNGNIDSNNMTEIMENIWIGKETVISSQTYLIGPVIIGKNCIIEGHAQIIGPAVIGDGCKIKQGALVRESILWEDSVIEKTSNISYCIIRKGLTINEGDSFRNKIVVDNLTSEEINFQVFGKELNGVTGTNAINSHISIFRYRALLGIKRIIDITCSFIGLIIFSPLILLISAVIKLDSNGSVIFRQKRCGKGGKDFNMFKFRTMVKDAHSLQHKFTSENKVDGPMFKLINDPRITWIGQFLRRTSLDELPQFINVLKGEMSLVGPRPLVMDEMKFSPSWRKIRLKVKPGITGLWQIQGRSNAAFHDWIRYDLYYVRNQSLWLDIKIILKTIKVVLKKVGAY